VEHCRAFCGANDLLVIEEYGDPYRSESESATGRGLEG
jgi:hypothetical protein